MMDLKKIDDNTYVNVGDGNVTTVIGGVSYSGGYWVKVNFLSGSYVEFTGKTLGAVVALMTKED